MIFNLNLYWFKVFIKCKRCLRRCVLLLYWS